ncbi:F-box protein At3g07870-like [Pyrus communis]|uniref:F-box protein At3g07870-like n=1 Tax=Pyrus communis TaxID=23211 RepID=UPI0035C12BD7
MRFTLKNSLPISDFKVINSCNGLPCLSGPGKYGPFAATNEYKVLQTFYPECESSSPDNLYETEISTIGTGVCRSIENAPWDYVCLSFNVFLHGALHWVSESTRQFDMWVMKEYGVQDSWTKTLVVENLYLRERSCDLYEPLIFLSNGEILMSYNDWIVVCYDPNRKNLRETRIARTQSDFRAYAYSPSFVSLYFASKGEEVKRVGTAKKLLNKRLAEGGSDCAGSSMPPHKSTKQNSSSSIPL